MYVYKQTEPRLWTVGHYTPKGEWIAESDHDNAEEASWRVHWLNGGEGQTNINNLSEPAKRYFAERAKPKGKGEIWE